MPQVAVNINGKMYKMACSDGQEAHLLELASQLNQSITRLKESFGEIGDQRLTVMAAIMAHDKLNELEIELEQIKNEMKKSKDKEKKLQTQIEKITQHITNITEKLRS